MIMQTTLGAIVGVINESAKVTSAKFRRAVADDFDKTRRLHASSACGTCKFVHVIRQHSTGKLGRHAYETTTERKLHVYSKVYTSVVTYLQHNRSLTDFQTIMHTTLRLVSRCYRLIPVQ